MKDMVWRLLRRNISIGQMVGYAAANLVGLVIVITALQFYRDVSGMFDDNGDSLLQHDYVSVSHRVGGFGSLASSTAPTGFTPEEVADLAAQPWVRRAGEYTASRFNVAASVDMGGGNMSTALFFESIPDDYFDIRPDEWKFDPQHPEIPIVLSKDYLTLYNFGFASSRGLPRLSEALIGAVPLRISLSGNGRQAWYPGRIVGFSSRLNTIAVPKDFMEWANKMYGDSMEDQRALPNRLIVELSRLGDPAIKEYLDSHELEMSGDNSDNASASYFLRVITTIVMSVGIVITMLAFFILTLSLWLLLSKNRDKLFDLMQLGYSPGAVSLRYYVMVCSINFCVLAGAIVLLLLSRHFWMSLLDAVGWGGASVVPTIIVGIAIVVLITLLNMITIHTRMRSYFRR